ncbi:MAG: isoprenyl transferase [Bacteroidaceae bacterium]|nr:isoprenyl transferase [Bacteroidaceae bacterium]MBQ6800386.1 isoprenyl transferase [Bacteroidaceae bacterium]
MTYKEQLDMNRIPEHVAIIMDGNGRWAKLRGEDRSKGHMEGVETVRRIVTESVKLGFKYLTLYTFSTENWNRPEAEVTALMGLLFDNLKDEIFMKNNVGFRVVGDMERMPAAVRERIEWLEQTTAVNTGMTLVLALSYSSKWEITRAVRSIATDVVKGNLKVDEVNEQTIASRLVTNFMPDPDLLIRTGGEVRLSNYLLWQCAYSELYFCDTLWPDFSEEELAKAVYTFQQKERRYGKTSEQVAAKQ